MVLFLSKSIIDNLVTPVKIYGKDSRIGRINKIEFESYFLSIAH